MNPWVWCASCTFRICIKLNIWPLKYTIPMRTIWNHVVYPQWYTLWKTLRLDYLLKFFQLWYFMILWSVGIQNVQESHKHRWKGEILQGIIRGLCWLKYKVWEFFQSPAYEGFYIQPWLDLQVKSRNGMWFYLNLR